MDIDWQENAGEAFAVRLAVTGEDRRVSMQTLWKPKPILVPTSTRVHTKDGPVFGPSREGQPSPLGKVMSQCGG